MRYVNVSEPGGPEVLQIAERPNPAPAADEIVISVRASGVSHADLLQREGKYPPPPGASDILGLEVSGVVSAVGEKAGVWHAGDEVCALLTGGGYAEFVAVPAMQVLPKPANWSFEEAASLPENMFTVYNNVFTRARLQPGERILIHGGSSGIGTTAIMLARAFGAKFIAATAGSEEKCRACREIGADLAINYNTEDFVERINSATENKGVDVVLDLVGGDYIGRDLDALALDGRITCIAASKSSAAELDLRKVLQKRAMLMGSSLRPRTPEQKGAIAVELRARVWPLLPQRDPIRPVIDSVYPFTQAAEAHRRLESSQHIGKIVLTPDF